MKPPLPVAALVASVLLGAAAVPGSITAQQAERSTIAAPVINSTPVQPKRVFTSRRIDAVDIKEVNAHNAYDAVLWLRSTWLQPRGVSRNGIRVYLDRERLGGIEELRHINARMIESVEYLSQVEATRRFGFGHGDGAILITARH